MLKIWWFIIIIWSWVFANCTLLIAENESSEDSLIIDKITCVNEILENFANLTQIIVLTNMNLNEQKLMMVRPISMFRINRIEESQGNLKELMKTNLYILDGDIDDIQRILKALHHFYSLNCYAYFIIFLKCVDAPDKALLSDLSFYYINRVLLINSLQQIWTYYPYKEESSNNPHRTPYLIGKCGNKEMQNFSTIGNTPKMWRNTTIRALLRVNAPYVIAGSRNGIEENLLKIINEKLGFKLDKKLLPFGTTALPYLKEKQQLKEHKFDLFGGHVTPNSEDVWICDISATFSFDTIRFLTPKPADVLFWSRFFAYFPINYWLVLLSTVIISYIITKFFYGISFQDQIFNLIKIFVEDSTDLVDTNELPLTIIFISWVFFFMIITTICKNSLIVISETTVVGKYFDTLKDIEYSGLPIHSMINLTHLYSSKDDQEVFNQIKIHNCIDYTSCFNSVLKNQNIVTIGGEHILRYHVLPETFQIHDEERVHISKSVIYGFHIPMLFTKGHPLYQQVYRIILLIMEGGLVAKDFATMEYKVQLRLSRHYESKISSKIFSMHEFYPLSYVWFIGIGLATVVFIMEILIRNIQRKTTKKTTIY